MSSNEKPDEIETISIDGWNSALDGSAVNIGQINDVIEFTAGSKDKKQSNFVQWGNSSSTHR